MDPLEHKDERLHASTSGDWRDALAAKRRELAGTDDDATDDDTDRDEAGEPPRSRR